MKLLQLFTRILCDILPERPADGVFLFGQTHDNEESVFQKAQQLIESQLANKILFMQTEPISGYPGFDAWKKELLNRGIAESSLVGIPPPDSTILHTLIEAESMAIYARQHNYRSVLIVASPFQQVRAFMTAVTAAFRHYPTLRLYSQPGIALPWLEEVVHSQGKVKGTRSSLIEGELQRIETYQQKGDLATAEEVLAYLNTRDLSNH